jgi:hypothetical protein
MVLRWSDVQPKSGKRLASNKPKPSDWPVRKVDDSTTYRTFHSLKTPFPGGSQAYCIQSVRQLANADCGIEGKPTYQVSVL